MKTRLQRIITLCCLISLSAATLCQAQKKARPKAALPRVGVIKDDQAQGTSLSGCDNHLLSFKKEPIRMFFTSRPDGLDAWMNVDGRNVQLRLMKTTLTYLDKYSAFAKGLYEYRYRDISVFVRLRVLTDYITDIPASVELRKGRAGHRRLIKAFVTAQCDAI